LPKGHQGIEQGIEKGQRRLFTRQIRSCFGAELASEAEGILGRLRKPEQLDQVGDWIVECATGAELLQRLHALIG